MGGTRRTYTTAVSRGRSISRGMGTIRAGVVGAWVRSGPGVGQGGRGGAAREVVWHRDTKGVRDVVFDAVQDDLLVAVEPLGPVLHVLAQNELARRLPLRRRRRCRRSCRRINIRSRRRCRLLLRTRCWCRCRGRSSCRCRVHGCSSCWARCRASGRSRCRCRVGGRGLEVRRDACVEPGVQTAVQPLQRVEAALQVAQTLQQDRKRCGQRGCAAVTAMSARTGRTRGACEWEVGDPYRPSCPEKK